MSLNIATALPLLQSDFVSLSGGRHYDSRTIGEICCRENSELGIDLGASLYNTGLDMAKTVAHINTVVGEVPCAIDYYLKSLDLERLSPRPPLLVQDGVRLAKLFEDGRLTKTDLIIPGLHFLELAGTSAAVGLEVTGAGAALLLAAPGEVGLGTLVVGTIAVIGGLASVADNCQLTFGADRGSTTLKNGIRQFSAMRDFIALVGNS